jgi:hypothetical protein
MRPHGAALDSPGRVLPLSVRGLLRRQPYLKNAIERGRKSQEINARLCGGFFLFLRDDEPERTEAFVQAALLRLSGQGAILPQYFGLEALLMIKLYQGRAGEAWQLFCERRGTLLRSGILRMELLTTLWDGLRAMLALASGQPQRLVEESEERLARSSSHFAGPMSALVRAVLRRRQGLRAESLALLQEAEEGLAACDMALHASCARFRRGQWLGGAGGAALVADARERMIRDGIKRPERMAAMLVPEPMLRRT